MGEGNNTAAVTLAAARIRAGRWLGAERSSYAEGDKWLANADRRGPVAELVERGELGEALELVRMYLHRSQHFAEGLGEIGPAALQALGKATVTLLQVFEAAGQHHGPLPWGYLGLLLAGLLAERGATAARIHACDCPHLVGPNRVRIVVVPEIPPSGAAV